MGPPQEVVVELLELLVSEVSEVVEAHIVGLLSSICPGVMSLYRNFVEIKDGHAVGILSEGVVDFTLLL